MKKIIYIALVFGVFALITLGYMNTMIKKEDTKGFLPNVDVSALPEAQETKVIEVSDGDRIELNPTLVRKDIHGKDFAMYGYNKQIPGPIIKAKQSATITIDVTNNIDMETTIHWHGIRLDNANDGVPDVTQSVIHPDGTFTYTVKFPDEGIYWYHPHVREDIQQDLGLYGNLLVIPTQNNAYAPANHEEFLVLDDIMLSEQNERVPYGEDDADHPLMGRFGNIMIINGEPAKEYSLEVARGSVTRFFLTNVANTRTFRIRIDGGAMKLVGSDVGRYEREEWVDAVTIAPAERYIVDVLFEDDGRFAMTHESPIASYDLGSIIVTPDDVNVSYEKEFNELRDNDDVIADIDVFRSYFDQPIDKTIELSIKLAGGMDHSMVAEHTDDGIEWPQVMSGVEWEDTMPQMNKMMTGEQVKWKMIDAETGNENMDINWQFKAGDIKKIHITNKKDSAHPMQHPIHFHGQRFLVLSMDGKPNDNLVWKDTVLIPTGSTADLLFDMSNPGDWMFHCHIAEHLTNGMMGMFTVSES
jgi:suppressor of ftsI